MNSNKQSELLLSPDWQAGLSKDGLVELRLVGTQWTATRFGAKYIVCLKGEELARVGSMVGATQFIETTRALEGL
jgi:hypothetical protein